MKHPLQCQCGTLKGFVDDPQRANRAVCYCNDCQAFAHFLGKSDEIRSFRVTITNSTRVWHFVQDRQAHLLPCSPPLS